MIISIRWFIISIRVGSTYNHPLPSDQSLLIFLLNLLLPVEIGLPKSTTSDYIETRAKVFALFSDNKNIFDHYHLCDIYGEIMERIIRNDIPENELENSKIYHYTFKSCDNLKFSILMLGNDDKLYTKYIVSSKTLIPF